MATNLLIEVTPSFFPVSQLNETDGRLKEFIQKLVVIFRCFIEIKELMVGVPLSNLSFCRESQMI